MLFVGRAAERLGRLGEVIAAFAWRADMDVAFSTVLRISEARQRGKDGDLGRATRLRLESLMARRIWCLMPNIPVGAAIICARVVCGSSV